MHCSVDALSACSEQTNFIVKSQTWKEKNRLFSEQPQYPVYQFLKTKKALSLLHSLQSNLEK